jgi:hypothetical protein
MVMNNMFELEHIPQSIAAKLKEVGAGPTGFGGLLEAAITRVLDAAPAERFGMMSAALSFMNEPTSNIEFNRVQPELVKQFHEYCHAKKLNAIVLLVGALLLELELVQMPQPELPEHCTPRAPDGGQK